MCVGETALARLSSITFQLGFFVTKGQNGDKAGTGLPLSVK